jgi:hypothetical protein
MSLGERCIASSRANERARSILGEFDKVLAVEMKSQKHGSPEIENARSRSYKKVLASARL